MSKSYRIRTTPGEDNGYLKVNVDLNQNYDHLEILSLKISQTDDYKNFCADYGVIAGRVIVNNGFGVPNVKVSIFIPVEESDLNDPVISSIYPYSDPFPDQKNSQGVRYNLLPKNKQSLDHTPVGTFPKKREILDNGTTLEIYEKYFKYTTTTNESGDYILFGVPVGEHILHYDMDISDIGFLSVRPFELINQGYSENQFQNRFKYKSSRNLESLPQIFSENIPVTVEPYWCDSLSVGSKLGINRYDISIDNIEITPVSVFLGGIFSDDEKDSLNKNCKPAREMGRLNEVITGSGKIESIRRTPEGTIEVFEFNESNIDDNGNWSVLVPMNLRKVVTDEFGNLVPSPDGVKGVATEGDYRFRISMDATSTDKKLRQRAKFLVPNTNNNFSFGSFSKEDINKKGIFTKNKQLSTITTGTPYENDLSNQYNYLEEFFPFRWKKVYTVKQYIGRIQKIGTDESRGFIGIKDIINAEGVNKFPTNRMDTSMNPLYSIICILVSFIGLIIGYINGTLNIINGLVTMICQLKIPVAINLNLVYCLNLPLGVELCNSNYRTDYCGCPNDDCGGGGQNCGKNCGKCGSKFTINPTFEYKCILSPLICENCKPLCNSGTNHSCCPNSDNPNDPNSYQYGCPHNGKVSNSTKCCSQCCVKVPLISLKCEDQSYTFTLIPTPFAPNVCNRVYSVPFGCKNCGGLQTAGLKDWVSCTMEPVAIFLRMLKFDFYNDWVGGSLYFPLIKRKYVLKKRKRKLGQIKKDKFCDFECRDRGSNDFQGSQYFKMYAIKIKSMPFSNPKIQVNGCTAKVKGKRISNWYGDQNMTEIQSKDKAAKELQFSGNLQSGDGCIISFNSYSQLENVFNSQNISFEVKDKKVANEHGKPEYIEVVDSNGVTSWKNIGGHGHQRNFCDDVRLMERKEYFKPLLDCNIDGPYDEGLIEGPLVVVNDVGETSQGCDGYTCGPKCGTNGVAPCITYNVQTDYDNFKQIIKHGLISWEDGEIYYTPYIPNNDKKNNKSEYKANLLLPTSILELGSMSYCDIDDVPFIMDQLPPTTFQASYEDIKYKIDSGGQYNGGKLKKFSKFKDNDDASLNLSNYVEYSCVKTICTNILGAVNQSQIGVGIIDANDIGVAKGSCFMRFEHDEEVRSYFCKKFNGYKAKDLSFHHNRPGSIEFDNQYNTFPEIKIYDNPKTYYDLPGVGIIESEYNDSESFIPGDACGYIDSKTKKVDYFYSLAPGTTNKFINYPNGNSVLSFGNNNPNNFGIKISRTQTPYYLYFGLIPGKTSLHKTVSNFFADKINAVTLVGAGSSENKVSSTRNNTPNINEEETNQATIYKTCLGETLIKKV